MLEVSNQIVTPWNGSMIQMEYRLTRLLQDLKLKFGD